MDIKLKKWFSNPDGKTRYKIVLPQSDFVEGTCPTKEVHLTANIQVVKDDTIQGSAKYNLTLFGEERAKYLERLNVPTTGLSWQREALNVANGITQATTEYMKKGDLLAVLEKVLRLEFADTEKYSNVFKTYFKGLKLK
jgi:hypothetical protein